MTEFRYRAYISYSHQDEGWAKWLQRALESYRIPRKLVGTETSVGKVPPRVGPVFRDRDDLSSSSDLGGSVEQNLTESESLIVLCSPEAAASHWVGEEIREFGVLGRQQRIFCVIVDGEPHSNDVTCFPPALKDIGLQEPLAADVRKWADGKQLAKLKLISGLLGLRLDDLRRRELLRQRKRTAVVGLGVVAALALMLMTVMSQISEQHERETAEQMATFIVELGEKLQSDTDLDTLALISREALKYYQRLDPDKLNPETGKKVALVMRQMAQISQLQGRPDEALEAFEGSRNILARLREKHPGIPGLLFELGNADYYIGNLYFRQGEYASAREAMQSYQRLTRTLSDSDPQNPDWIMELAYAHNNLAALQLDSGLGVDDATLEHIAQAIRLMETVMELKPGDEVVVSHYANTLAYAADAQSLACNLENAMPLRERARDLAESLAQSNPGNNERQELYAYQISGVAVLQTQLGRTASAEQNLELSISILQQLSVADPSHVVYRQEALYQRLTLARLVAESGRLDEARSMLQSIGPGFEPAGESADQDIVSQDIYVNFLLAYADVDFQLGDKQAAGDHLQEAIQLKLAISGPPTWDRQSKVTLMRARYQWWEVHGEDAIDSFPLLSEVKLESVGAFQSCAEADVAARMHILEGNRDGATTQVAYLKDRAYADPAFVRFCSNHGLCME